MIFHRIFLLICCAVVLACFFIQSRAESFSQRRRRTREVEDKLNKLDDATKQRIHAMKASGMPNEAIAEKIAYVAGGKGTAKRIVEALQHEPPKKSKPQAKSPPKPTAPKLNNVKQPTNTKRK